jgi:hemerythrin-like metal-binding protein
MNTIIWTEKYSVGVPELDAQHQKIIALINKLNECVRGERELHAVSYVMNEMHSYIIDHFGYEEKLLAKIHYPHLDEQKVSHNAFIKQFSYICAEVNTNKMETVQYLVNFLNEWWDTHILLDDMKYKQLLSKG